MSFQVTGILPQPGNKHSSRSLTRLHSDLSIMRYSTTKCVHIWRHNSVNIDILISYDDVITLSNSSSLYPHHQLNTWWPCNDEAALNGIRSPWHWRPASVINHSVFWNTNSPLMPIRGLNVDNHVHVYGRCCTAVNLCLWNCSFIRSVIIVCDTSQSIQSGLVWNCFLLLQILQLDF